MDLPEREQEELDIEWIPPEMEPVDCITCGIYFWTTNPSEETCLSCKDTTVTS